MQTIRPLQLIFYSQVLEQNRKFCFTASATLGVNLQTGEAVLEFDALRDAFECMGEKPLPDMGMPKPRGEFLISGSFFPPESQDATEGWVRVRIAHQEKELYVFGPRKWHNGFPSKSEPFTSMPIDFAHAFGGEGYKKNPDGMGYKDGKLPCIENPKHLVGSPGDTPEPAGFSPLNPSWPQRMKYQGTYDSSYLQKYFPGYPEDLDWHFFLCAPKDQWIRGYFQGNESFEIHHMHPDIPVIRGNLPDLYARCFLNHTINRKGEPQFSELPLNPDTIWLFPEKLLGLMIWRGVIEVADDEAEQISHVLVAYEDRAHPPRAHEHYRHALERRISSDDSLLNYFNTEDLIPIGTKCAMELLQESAFADDEESEFSKNLDAKAAGIRKMADEKIEEAIQQAEKAQAEVDDLKDVRESSELRDMPRLDLREQLKAKPKPDPDVEELSKKLETLLPGITAGDPKKIQLKEFSFDKIDKMMAAVDELMGKKEKQAKDEIAKVRPQIEEQLKKAQDELDNLPKDEKEGMADQLKDTRAQLQQALDMMDMDPEKQPKSPLPRINAEEIIAQIGQVSPQITEAMQHLQGMKDMGAEDENTRNLEKQLTEMLENQDQQIRDGLQQAEKNFKETYIMAAHFMEDGLSPHKEPVEDVEKRLLAAIAQGKDVSEKDWACTDLSGQNLDGADFSGAFLEQADFTGTSLRGANLSKAILARANLTDADLTGANLEEANVGGVKALRANFTDANLKSARLSKGNFTDANFTRSELEDAESLEILVNGTNFSEAHMPAMKFIESQVNGTKFQKADMSTSVFYDCDIRDADFSEAGMNRCTWADVRLENVIFDGADLTASCFAATDPEKSVLKNVRFRSACLDKCNFQSMNMQGADLSRASLENANFSMSDLTEADLSHAQARHAVFRKAKLTHARLNHINLPEGSLAKAHLVSATFVGANLYATDFLRATFGETDFRGSNLESTLIQDWRPL